MKINYKLTLSFFVIAFSSILIIGFLAYFKGKNSLENESFNRLTAVREMKSTQIEDYFLEIENQIITFSEDHTIVNAMREFNKGFDSVRFQLDNGNFALNNSDSRLNNYYQKEFLPRLNANMEIVNDVEHHWPSDTNARILQDIYISSNPNEVGSKHYLSDPLDGTTYGKTHQKYHPLIRSYLEKFDYYDIFMVDDVTGNIVYSVFKEVDFATSLNDGPYKNTNIARAFREARDSDNKDFVKIVDFEPYHPSYNAPAAFIASPIFDGDEKLGVLIFQMPIDKINNIMTNRHEWADVGLGQSGETYIVADDYTLRNQSRFFIEDQENYFKMIEDIGTPESTITKIKNFESTVGLQEVRTLGTEEALKGKSDTKIFEDYRGVPVLSSYQPLNIKDMHWVIMSEIDRDEAFSHVYDLRKNIIIVFIGLLLSIIIASLFISRKITKPIKTLTAKAEEVAGGNLDVEFPELETKDEIGILSESFGHMQKSVKDLVVELKDINANLEHKVEERTRDLQKQKEVVEEKNREIVDSIHYALRLQQAIIPTEEKVRQVIPESFVLFLPKDIVSGDFYWMAEVGEKAILTAVDCTGHGVPGAMVSVIGANGLNRCVKEFGLRKPSSILDKLKELVVETFESSADQVRDGMDCALCLIDQKNRTVEYAGAHNPLWIVRKGAEEIEEIKADKQPIGDYEFFKPFTNHKLQLEEGDVIYFFSDGYSDQFGGEKGKKFKYKTLKKLLVEIHQLSVDEQEDILLKKFLEWKGDFEQVDDVCLIGVRF